MKGSPEFFNTQMSNFPKHTMCKGHARKKFIFCKQFQIHNQLIRKCTLNHLAKLISLAKWLSVRFLTKWLWVRIPLQSLKLQMLRLF